MPKSKQVVAMLFAVVALLFGAAACGGDDGGGASSSNGSRPGTAPASEPPATEGSVRADKRASAASADEKKRSEGPSSSDSSSPASARGSKKLHGDGSIETFGDEASSDDSSAAIVVAEAFYAARAADDWKGVCDLMSSGIKQQLAQTFEGKGCATAVPVLVGGLPKTLRQQQAQSMTFTEVRVEDDGAYVLFESDTIPHGFLPMHREGGDWKVAAIAGSSL